MIYFSFKVSGKITGSLLISGFCLFCFMQAGCVKQFMPETSGNKYLLVVEAVITDQPEGNSINLSRTQPLNNKKFRKVPVREASVWITDDLGQSFNFIPDGYGSYVPSFGFTGNVGRKYALHVVTYDTLGYNTRYESVPVEMKPVPIIDSIYYEKILIQPSPILSNRIENCQIYLDTHDETGQCKYYRWDYAETWEFHLHWPGEKPVCWLSENSKVINVKSTEGLSKDYITKFPLRYIDQNTDRLEVIYSILVNQYSLTVDEYSYWQKLKSVTQDVGGLYDLIASNIPSNIICTTDHSQQVLGYFSVSAKSSKRIFINEHFAGQINLYLHCPIAKIENPGFIAGLGQYLWILENDDRAMPPYIIITNDKGCVDCTMRGSDIRPDFWPGE